MPVSILTPDKILRRTHKKQVVSEQNLNNFKTNLTNLLEKLKDHNREGKQETDLRDFLNDSYYKNRFYINKKETADWVIFNDENGKGKVSVIIEMKSTSAKTEMLTEAEPNVKALHELILYYLRERIDYNNHHIKHLIATNGLEWYIFNELWFDEHFFTATFKKSYQDWKLSGHSTDDFYKLYAKPHIANLDVVFCKLDLRDYTKASNRKLSELYKILSPEHLLKLEIANDANKLNRPFYNELLYILGIEERKAADSNKKIIDRIVPDKRQDGSLIENVINKLNVKDCLRNVKNLESFGETREDQLYSVALELCITWLNRILFLKLLESQLVKYHIDDKSFKFLSYDKIHDFDELSELFFEVLAIPTIQRTESVNKKFGQIPYLNSSLFELSDLEKETISIEDLKDRLEVAYFGNSVLVNDNGKPQKGEVNTLKYLLGFLDAYRFGASDDEESIKQDKLINAAVLGLIFEKLNGYKDGSFYTPAFITMYMCRETIRRAVVQKFNETNNWGCETFEDLFEHIEYKNLQERKAYNEQINNIKICDPAVGSGHFLVSALNEMIAIKSELKILQHPNGTRIKDIEISIDNDELTVYDQNEGQDFNYTVGKGGGLISEKQLLQETLFEEKRTIIENCLFGVDINPKSVKICQLRLWIELLKNAYYKPDGELETLPNIDINIKSGNSLVSKYALDEDLSEVFKKQKFGLDIYKDTVAAYKEAKTKETKAEFKNFISEIKEAFKQSVINTDPRRKKQNELYWKLEGLKANIDLFGNKKLSDAELKKQKIELEKQKQKIDEEIRDIEDNKIFKNSFEWRFEFPEVLNEKGDFVGFDVVIGNPPYFSLSKLKDFGKLFQANYSTYSKSSDIYCLFYEKANKLVKPEGFVTFITSNSWLKTQYGESLRVFFEKETNPIILINIEDAQVFEEATVESNILMFRNEKFKKQLSAVTLSKDFNATISIKNYFQENLVNLDELDTSGWNIGNFEDNYLKAKIEENTLILKDWNVQINFGIKTGLNDVFIIPLEKKNEFEKSDPRSLEIIKPILKGRDLKKYHYTFGDLWIINSHNGLKSNGVERVDVERDYKTIWNYFKENEEKMVSRYDQGDHWSNLRNCAYLLELEKPKILWGELSDKAKFSFDENGYIPEATLFFMVGENLKFLLGILNSKLSEWYFDKISTTTGMGTNRWKKYKIEQLPIKKISENAQAPFIEKVDEILALKKADPAADTSTLEAEIDRMVYELYELTEEEIAIVEGI
jgi:type II restriction/modification system DNA methylase subunit YeeA